MTVPDRQPYAGELVFTAFSGSHQDAIKKGLDRREKDGDEKWGVPYLTIDPHDIGRTYEAIVRINSQSGKGGVAYILDQEHGYDLPKTMHPQVGKRIYDLADQRGEELSAKEVGDVFFTEFVNVNSHLMLKDYELDYHSAKRGDLACKAVIEIDGESKIVEGVGNGPINAFVQGFEETGLKDFTLTDYRSHAVRGGSSSDAAAYVQLRKDDGTILWGVGCDPSIEMAGVKALVCAWNLLR
jgi:2-isopropylmalate synthase